MFNIFIYNLIINNISIKNLFFYNSKKKISKKEKNKFNDLSYDEELPEKNLTFGNIEQKNIRINDSIYYFGDRQESNNRKKNVTVDDILPLYIYENKLKLEEIYFCSDIRENQKKIPIITENIQNNYDHDKTDIKDLIISKASRENENKKTQYTNCLKIKSEKVSIVTGVNNDDNNPKNNFKKINEGEEPLPSLNINSLPKIQNNRGII